MARWGWLALLAIPGWLLWITGLGYSDSKICFEGSGSINATPPVTPAERAACSQTVAAWAPFRGLKFGTHGLTGEYWVAGLIAAVLFASLVLFLAFRAGALKKGQRGGQ